MPLTKPVPVDDITLHRPTLGWNMNQELANELQRDPQYPLVFGVDGRFSGTMRRFRGFKRLDYDIRFPNSNASRISAPIIGHGEKGGGPTLKSPAQAKTNGPHDWACKGSESIDPDNHPIYQFVAGTLDRSRRTQGFSDRRPVSVFAIHTLDGDGKPCVKLLGRSIGDASRDALFQVCLVGGYTGQVEPNPILMDLRLNELAPLGGRIKVSNEIDWVGIAFLGRYLILSHKEDPIESATYQYTWPSAGDTWVFDIPYKAWRAYPKEHSYGADKHTFDYAESDFPDVDAGVIVRGDKFARCKLAGTRDFAWLYPDPKDEETGVTLNVTAVGAVDNWILGAGVDKVTAVDSPDDEDTSYIYNLGYPGIQEFTSLDPYTLSTGKFISRVEAVVRVKEHVVSAFAIYYVTATIGSNTTLSTKQVGGGAYADLAVNLARPGGGDWKETDFVDLTIGLQAFSPIRNRVTTFKLVVYEQPIGTSDGAIRYLGFADPANVVAHEANNQFRARIRLVNYTTGFVSPMSTSIQLSVGPSKEGVKLSWVPGTNLVTETTAGAVNIGRTYTDFAPFVGLLRSVFGVDCRQEVPPLSLLAGGEGGPYVRTGYPRPDSIGIEGAYDVRLQVWVTQSVPSDNPSGGGGYYYLDQEIPVVFRRPRMGIDPVLGGFGSFDLFIWPGWIGDEHLGSQLIGRKIPNKSNDELISSEVYIPESDDVGPLEPSASLGALGTALVSLSDGGKVDVDQEASTGDIRVSPPWKFYPGGWIEAVAPLYRHRVDPKGKNPPTMVKVGDLLFFVNENKVVRLVRDGSTILADDIDVSGGINRDGVTGTGQSVVIVTASGIETMNPITMKQDTVRAVQRIISEKWHSYAQQGQIMSGYDPQLKAVFIAPRRAYTSTEWLRSEALILWLTTGRVTMLSDVYWTGMSRGVHPLTGKEHLFFIDPAENITYADDSLDDESPATMVGINAVNTPSVTRRTVTWTIKVLGTSFASGAAIMVDGMPLEEGVGGSWSKSSGTVNGIATSIRDAINSYKSSVPDENVATATVSTDTVTVSTLLVGSINEECALVALKGIPEGTIQLAKTVSGESTSGDYDVGGAYQGFVTLVQANTPTAGNTRIRDGALQTSGEGPSFDEYAWYNPHNVDSLGILPVRPALVGAQVYFFRIVADDRGISRPTLVADGRIKSNLQQYLVFNDSELNYHNGATSILVDDHYSVSPVVFQAVGAPLDVNANPGSGIDNSGSIEALSAYIGSRKGAAAENGTRLPASNPLQGSLFFGVARRADLEKRLFGSVVKPELEVGEVFRRGAPGESDTLFWAEESTDPLTEMIGVHGNSLFPVITCYGANYQFDLVSIGGRVARTGHVSGESPEGI